MRYNILLHLVAIASAAPLNATDLFARDVTPPARVDQSHPPPNNEYTGQLSNKKVKIFYEWPNSPNCPPVDGKGDDWIPLRWGQPWKVDDKLPQDKGIAAIAIFSEDMQDPPPDAVSELAYIRGPTFMAVGNGFMKDAATGGSTCGPACGTLLPGNQQRVRPPHRPNTGGGGGYVLPDGWCPNIYYLGSKTPIRAFNYWRDEVVKPMVSLNGPQKPGSEWWIIPEYNA